MNPFWTSVKETFVHLVLATLPLALLAAILSFFDLDVLLAAAITIILMAVEIKIVKKWILPWLAETFSKIFSGSDDPADEDILIKAAKKLQREGDIEGTNAILRQYTDKNTSLMRAWLLRASILKEEPLLRYDDAITALREALHAKNWKKQDKALLLFKIGRIYEIDKKDRTKALDYYHEAADKYPATAYGREAAKKLH